MSESVKKMVQGITPKADGLGIDACNQHLEKQLSVVMGSCLEPITTTLAFDACANTTIAGFFLKIGLA